MVGFLNDASIVSELDISTRAWLWRRNSSKQIHDKPGKANTLNSLQRLSNTTRFPLNTRENVLLYVSKNRDTEAAQELNLVITEVFLGKFCSIFAQKPCDQLNRKHANLGRNLHFVQVHTSQFIDMACNRKQF